jgi:HK97 family phage major capsid protein
MALALARAGRGGVPQAVEIAGTLWGFTSTPAIALRSAVTPGATESGNWAATLAEYRVAAADFIEALRPATILGKLSGFRRAPFRTKISRTVAASTAFWIGEGAPTPLSQMALDTIQMDNFKIGGICVSTAELAKLSTPKAETVIRQDLLAAVTALSDSSFIDPSNAGIDGVSPASITNGAPTIAASGVTAAALRTDLRSLFAKVTTNLQAPVLITDRRQAVAIALMDDPAFQNVTASGGLLADVPLITSTGVPHDGGANSPAEWSTSITLLDAADLIVADDGEATIDVSGQADLQMSSTPDSPATASTTRVSLFQQNLLAWKATRFINWQMARDGAVASISGANYGE